MATQKPISTISYNSESFLREKLEEWYKAHIIQSYQYICHKGEEGDKDHIHLRIEPNKRIDPMELADMLKEYKFGDSKPLGVRPFRPSKEEDWILYAVHDKDYLKEKYRDDKNEKLPYDWTDIKVPEDYDMEIAYIRARASLRHSSVSMASRIQSGENPLSIILEGENPYTINAIVRALTDNDYKRLAQEHEYLKDQHNQLVEAVKEAGFEIVYENGIKLEKVL